MTASLPFMATATLSPPRAGAASPFIPPDADLEALRAAAAGCTACPLHKLGSQTVFGRGPERAPLMMVGEQPGDQEDRAGLPFVGPAGQLLDRALAEAGIDRTKAYVTNAVKHFKWVPRGKKRIHSKPSTGEVRACKPWLEAELARVQPDVLVLLGATAAQSLLGADFRVSQSRGRRLASNLAPNVLATIHPSAILRGEPADREDEFARFVGDLKVVAKLLD